MAEPKAPATPKGEDNEFNIGRRVEPNTPAAPAAATKEATTPAPVAPPQGKTAPAKPVESTGDSISSLTSLHFDAPLPGWLLLILVVALGFSAWRAYLRTTRRLTLARKGVLVGLRGFAALLLVVCIARPVVVHTQQLHEKGVCFVAVDTSSSMSIRDGVGGVSRWEQSAAILKQNADRMNQLRERFDLQRYQFDRATRPVSLLPGESGALAQEPEGAVTDLSSLLETLTAEAGGLPTAGALILTDGRHNAPKDVLPAALQLERAGVPLYVIGLGQDATPADFKDIRIRDMVVPEKAFVNSQLILRIEVESTLPTPARSPLIVEINGKKAYEGYVDLQPGTNIVAPAIEVPYSPQTLGIHRVVAILGALPDEANFANNTRAAFFRVYRTKLGIWYVEGAIRKEFGSLRAALETAPNASLKAINAFNARTSLRSELLPTSAEDKAQLRLVILGDIAPSRFEPEALKDLALFVEQGGALLTLGGLNSYGAGDWQRTTLAPVFPVEMGSDDGLKDGPLQILVEPSELTHPALAVGIHSDHSLMMWKQLPPLAGLNRIFRTRPLARTLLKADTSPLLVVQEYGRGRSAAFMGDTTWQWVLKGDQPELHKKFWRNLVTWLTRSDYNDTTKSVFVDSERLQYQAGEEVAFRTFVHEIEKSRTDIKKAPIVATLTRINGTMETPVFKEELGKGIGEYSKHVTLNAGGTYRYKASALDELGAVIDSDSIDIQVSTPDIEHDNPKANLKLLRRIATLSGGTYYDPAQANQAFDALLKREAGFAKTLTDVTDVWNRPWMLVLILLLLSTEWFLRKRWSLV